MNILAVQLQEPQEMGFFTNYGFYSLLKVRSILGKVQTTIFYGDTLHLLGRDVGQLNQQQAFDQFCGQFKDRVVTWGHYDEVPPNPLIMTRRIYLNPMVRPPEPPLEEGQMKLVGSGFDPLKGFWIEFLGNYWLHIPIFRDFQNVKRVFD